jgi:hypothetical protein
VVLRREIALVSVVRLVNQELDAVDGEDGDPLFLGHRLLAGRFPENSFVACTSSVNCVTSESCTSFD